MCASGRPNLKSAMDNLRQTLPLRKKVSLFIKNSLIKITGLKSCCGHRGQPTDSHAGCPQVENL